MKFATTSLVAAVLSTAVIAAPATGPESNPYLGASTYDITGLTMRNFKDKIQSVSFTIALAGKTVAECNEPQFNENSLSFCLFLGGSSGYYFQLKNNIITINGAGNHVPNTAKVALPALDCHVNGGDMSGGDTNTKYCRQTQPQQFRMKQPDGPKPQDFSLGK